MNEKTELEVLEKELICARKAVTAAQKRLKRAHESIAEYEAGQRGLKKGLNYYVKVESELWGTPLPIGTRLEITGFSRWKAHHNSYDTMVVCVVDGNKNHPMFLDVILRILGIEGE